LTDADIRKVATNIAYFRGVFMRDNLPEKPYVNESAIVNLDSSNGPGTHWVAYKKRRKLVKYFDSFGDLAPPSEIVKYFKGCDITFNHDRYQKFNTWNCGHLCIKFLRYK
jgi:hypothetical protein